MTKKCGMRWKVKVFYLVPFLSLGYNKKDMEADKSSLNADRKATAFISK